MIGEPNPGMLSDPSMLLVRLTMTLDGREVLETMGMVSALQSAM